MTRMSPGHVEPVADERWPAAPGVAAPPDALEYTGAPRMRSRTRSHAFGTNADKFVVTPTMDPIAVEQYRKVIATLYHAQMSRGLRTLMIASALSGEGKTLTATNLALTLSQSYRRQTLLVDADLRRPSLHQVFGLPHTAGLAEALAADREVTPDFVELSPDLSFLPGGRPDPDPMSGLSSPRMKRFLTESTASFEWVIVDTPPVGMMADANLLASMVDAVILVVSAGNTPCRLVQRAIETIGRNRIIGVVLNRVTDRKVLSASTYYGYGQYGARDGRA